MSEGRSETLIYNTLTREKERLTTGPTVGIYVCGVTPYDTTHLGHAFTYTAFDVLVRFLRFTSHHVIYVQNVTDVDDDILLRAASTGMDWKELGDRELRGYQEDMRRLNNVQPDVMPRATEHIADMVRIIEELVRKGLGYVRDGNVYFDVSKAKDFGRLCRLDYPAMLELANERGNFPNDPLKRDPLDFVLWQAKREGEPAWSSPWGEGRPGWHIECSTMSMKYLGETITIHGGGQDLIFPHHECEIAQSESYTGKPFVRYWLHTGLVYCGGKKMSKSLGNMVFLSRLLEQHPADALRLYLLGHHYRRNWNYEPRELVNARAQAEALARAAATADEASSQDLERWGRPFLDAIADDLDTPRAVGELVRLTREADASAQRALRTLGHAVLGLTFARRPADSSKPEQ